MSNVTIMKFGGTSVGDAERIANVASLVSHHPDSTVVVVSAMAGITDLLILASGTAAKGHRSKTETIIKRIRDKHSAVIDDLKLGADVLPKIDELIAHLRLALADIIEQTDCTPRDYDKVMSFGERLSVQLVSAALRKIGVDSVPVEATSLIVTSAKYGDAEPDLEASTRNVVKILQPIIKKEIVPVVTGFIGMTEDGEITTLGRGASDYTATILGYCLDASQVWIWTDVTGVMTADPRLIPEAETISELTYQEAAELSYFGAKVLHPLTIVPASLKQIPIYIRNTFEPQAVGTKISADTSSFTGRVKAVTVRNDLSLITVQGVGVTGVPRVASKVFGSLADNDIDVFLVSQASSEHNMSLVVKGSSSVVAAEYIHGALGDEMSSKTVDLVQLKNGLSIVAVVGNGVNALPGITSQTFASLGSHDVDIVAIAYGSSSQSLSFVVDSSEATIAIKTLHQAFNLVKGDSR